MALNIMGPGFKLIPAGLSPRPHRPIYEDEQQGKE